MRDIRTLGEGETVSIAFLLLMLLPEQADRRVSVRINNKHNGLD